MAFLKVFFGQSGAAAGGVTVTPGALALVITTFAAVVSVTAHQVVTPTPAALTLSAFAPTVTVAANQTVTPATAVLTTTAFAPTVSVTANQTVTPTAAALTTAAFAPTVTASDHKTVTPSTLALVTAGFAPTVTATQNQTVTPITAALTLSAFAPTVTASGEPAPLPDSPRYFELSVPPSMPSGPDFASAAPRDPQVDHDFHALARMATVQSYLEDVEQWMRDELGEGDEMVDVAEAEGLELDTYLFGRRGS